MTGLFQAIWGNGPWPKFGKMLDLVDLTAKLGEINDKDLINRMENMDPAWLCCTISLLKDITLSFLTANVSIKDAIVSS